MKRLLWLALLLPTLASAQSAMTTKGTLACASKQWLDDAMDFAIAKDMDSLQAYISGGRCIILKEGLRVTITDAGFLTHEFVVQGIKLYTPRENLRLLR